MKCSLTYAGAYVQLSEAYKLVEEHLRANIRPNTPHVITITLGTNQNGSPFLFASDFILGQGTKYAQNLSSLHHAINSLFPEESDDTHDPLNSLPPNT